MSIRRLMIRVVGSLFALATLLGATGAEAHKPSDSYLSLGVAAAAPSRVEGQWDIALRDLDFVLGLDRNDDGLITWGELRAQQSAVVGHALARLSIAGDGAPCDLAGHDLLVDQHSDGAYAVIRFSAACRQAIATLDVEYRLFFDIDRQHKGLLKLQSGVADEKLQTTSTVFAADRTTQRFELAAAAGKSRWQYFGDYVGQGVWHIWVGIDHILFLVSLLLPAVLWWLDRRWTPVGAFKPAALEVLKVVTAFTIAHSITLSAATLGWVALPSRLVESVIALSVVLAALNNLLPRIARGRWLVAFGFGLIHGFGFASVLADLGLPSTALLVALLGFNVGVELGQLVIVAAFLPLAFALRRTGFYRRVVMAGGSLLIAAVATLWLAERALNLKFMPF